MEYKQEPKLTVFNESDPRDHPYLKKGTINLVSSGPAEKEKGFYLGDSNTHMSYQGANDRRFVIPNSGKVSSDSSGVNERRFVWIRE